MKRSLSAVVAACLACALAQPAGAQSDEKPAPKRTAKKDPKAEPKREAKKKEAKKPAPKPDGSAKPGGATLVASFNDWGAYTATGARGKICYALSEPKARSAANLKDTKAYLFVSFRPTENVRNEVAAVLNFKTKEDGAAALAIGTTNYALVMRGENAWIANASDEAAAIGAMSKGGNVAVQTTSARGNKITDRYSLAGFAQALDRAKRDCP